MPETDIPLKLLVQMFPADFAAWLLETPDIAAVEPLNVELPAGALRSDTVLRVVLAN